MTGINGKYAFKTDISDSTKTMLKKKKQLAKCSNRQLIMVGKLVTNLQVMQSVRCFRDRERIDCTKAKGLDLPDKVDE